MSGLTAGEPAITRDDIQALLPVFYDSVRRHPSLGPIFHRHIGTEATAWTEHLVKIEAFWANVLLRERRYQGNPMEVHRAIPEIEPGDFTDWLGLFDEAARDVLPPSKARIISSLAHRIGRSLSIGLDRVRTGVPPVLSG